MARARISRSERDSKFFMGASVDVGEHALQVGKEGDGDKTSYISTRLSAHAGQTGSSARTGRRPLPESVGPPGRTGCGRRESLPINRRVDVSTEEERQPPVEAALTGTSRAGA